MKLGIDDLALFGGPATFTEPLYVGRPSTGDRARFFERLNRALDDMWLTNGTLVREFEDRVAEAAGVRNCVATCNATTALQLLYMAAGLSGEVIMPSMTYVATAHAARMLGLTPVFRDIDPATGCLDPRAAEAAVTSRTSGVVGVHLWGRPAPIAELEKTGARHGLRVLFDAAHALGCTYRGRRIGGFGDAEVFSFHATKVVNSFEGGAVVTDDDGLAQHLRSLRTFGSGTDGRIERAGTNAKMSEAAAAMGLTSLEAFDRVVLHNRENHALYRSELRGVAGVSVVPFDEGESSNHQYVIARIDEAGAGLHRDLLMRVLKAENVVARRYFSPACHQLEPYRSERPVELPHTERLAEQVLALPTGPAVSAADVRRICEIVRCAAASGRRVTDRARRTADPAPAPPVPVPSGLRR
ncbi:DegT/DnrJ/EryC1/StrS family aminotransferase [Actinomadura livida]|uniref:Aminotransferase class I/II-fold pyridoxal phosphate-dependent enzyme n=1 Tax=Actinomadura livida TaxID=79909 RepID=A0A7W7IFI7_9ACTN|nr:MULTISPECIES: DegT/DnrJ/EryC1/StrS family aminotransferase [Actinomadura]MBB4776050.1 dTDP-4-amino-4,6-dideoxyglucose [Actinomadura catellatispora]GGU15841.1 dTDP-4-dehydro-6-deoxyglucose aminotransferase [Actinomadura livida]